MLWSSLVVRSRVTREEVSFQQGRAASLESEVSRLQKLFGELEQQLAEARSREQDSADEAAKYRNKWDNMTDKLEKSGLLVVELREAMSQAKQLAVDEFKSSSKFLETVEDSTSKYFGEGFDFCKLQLCRYHPDLAINLEDMVLDHDLFDKEKEGEEGERENMNNEDKGNTEPPPS